MYMSGSVRSWIHYIEIRAGIETQLEHRLIAEAAKKIFKEQFPNIAAAWNGKDYSRERGGVPLGLYHATMNVPAASALCGMTQREMRMAFREFIKYNGPCYNTEDEQLPFLICHYTTSSIRRPERRSQIKFLFTISLSGTKITQSGNVTGLKAVLPVLRGWFLEDQTR